MHVTSRHGSFLFTAIANDDDAGSTFFVPGIDGFADEIQLGIEFQTIQVSGKSAILQNRAWAYLQTIHFSQSMTQLLTMSWHSY